MSVCRQSLPCTTVSLSLWMGKKILSFRLLSCTQILFILHQHVYPALSGYMRVQAKKIEYGHLESGIALQYHIHTVISVLHCCSVTLLFYYIVVLSHWKFEKNVLLQSLWWRFWGTRIVSDKEWVTVATLVNLGNKLSSWHHQDVCHCVINSALSTIFF